jgi:hypothetical protein
MLNINIKADAAHAVFMVSSRELGNSVDQQPHAATALRYWTRTRLLTHKQTKIFAAHEQLRSADAYIRYPGLEAE